MFCKALITATTLTFGLSATPSGAATKTQLESAGAESCQTFLHKAGPNGLKDNAANQWVLGYLTGRVAAEPNARHYRFDGPEAIIASIVSYCRATGDFGGGIDIDAAAASFFMRIKALRRH
jgi:hypothetical protein